MIIGIVSNSLIIKNFVAINAYKTIETIINSYSENVQNMPNLAVNTIWNEHKICYNSNSKYILNIAKVIPINDTTQNSKKKSLDRVPKFFYSTSLLLVPKFIYQKPKLNMSKRELIECQKASKYRGLFKESNISESEYNKKLDLSLNSKYKLIQSKSSSNIFGEVSNLLKSNTYLAYRLNNIFAFTNESELINFAVSLKSNISDIKLNVLETNVANSYNKLSSYLISSDINKHRRLSINKYSSRVNRSRDVIESTKVTNNKIVKHHNFVEIGLRSLSMKNKNNASKLSAADAILQTERAELYNTQAIVSTFKFLGYFLPLLFFLLVIPLCFIPLVGQWIISAKAVVELLWCNQR